MRWARSYSIIDHEILHGGYLSRLSHEAMVLYLFLVVVGDRQGRSFYSDGSIREILRLSSPLLEHAGRELVSEDLIYYRQPYWEVRNIAQRRRNDAGSDNANDTVFPGHPEAELLSDTGADRDFAKACLAHISRILSGQEKETVSAGRPPAYNRGVVQGPSVVKSATGPPMADGKRIKNKLHSGG